MSEKLIELIDLVFQYYGPLIIGLPVLAVSIYFANVFLKQRRFFRMIACGVAAVLAGLYVLSGLYVFVTLDDLSV